MRGNNWAVSLLLIFIFIGCSGQPEKLPSAIDFTKSFEIEELDAEGITQDRWVEDSASLYLGNTKHNRILELRGTNVQTGLQNEALEIYCSVNGVTLDTFSIKGIGDFTEHTLLPTDISIHDTLLIHFIPSKKFIPFELGISSDDRVLSFRISKIAMVAESDAKDIFPEMFSYPMKQGTDSHVVGIDQDGWMGDSATVEIFNGGEKKGLIISGFCPAKVFTRIPTLDVYYDDALLVKNQFSQKRGGKFNFQLQLSESEARIGQHTIVLKANETFIPAQRGINSDQRKLSYQYKRIAYE